MEKTKDDVLEIFDPCIEFKDIRFNGKVYAPYIGDDGIYSPMFFNSEVLYQRIVPKHLFIEAYNQWIKEEENCTS